MNPNDRHDRYANPRPSSWALAADGLGTLRLVFASMVVSTIVFKLVDKGDGVTLVKAIVDLAIATFLAVGFRRWKAVPESGSAAAGARVAYAGSLVSLCAMGLGLLIALLIVGGLLSSYSAPPTMVLILGLAILAGFGLQFFGFLVSARATALALQNRGTAAMSTQTLVSGLVAVVVVLLPVLGLVRSKGGMALLGIGLVAAFVSFILFLVVISDLKRTIEKRPDLAESFR